MGAGCCGEFEISAVIPWLREVDEPPPGGLSLDGCVGGAVSWLRGVAASGGEGFGRGGVPPSQSNPQ